MNRKPSCIVTLLLAKERYLCTERLTVKVKLASMNALTKKVAKACQTYCDLKARTKRRLDLIEGKISQEISMGS